RPGLRLLALLLLLRAVLAAAADRRRPLRPPPLDLARPPAVRPGLRRRADGLPGHGRAPPRELRGGGQARHRLGLRGRLRAHPPRPICPLRPPRASRYPPTSTGMPSSCAAARRGPARPSWSDSMATARTPCATW